MTYLEKAQIVKKFYNQVLALEEFYGVQLGHEDEQGAFLIEFKDGTQAIFSNDENEIIENLSLHYSA